MKYSKIARGFFDERLSYPSLPKDLQEITDEEHQVLIDGQSQGFEIDFETDPPSLKTPVPAPREHYIERAKTYRTTIEQGGVFVDGHWFHTDESSLLKYVSLVSDAQFALSQGATQNTVMQIGGQPLLWQTMDNGLVQLKISTVLGIKAAVGLHSNACFVACRNHIEQLKIVDDYWDCDYTANYPAVYRTQTQS